MGWQAKPVDDDRGPRWVVEHHTGYQQHHGYRYTDQALAEYWAKTLNAFYWAWGLDTDQKGNKG